MRQPLLTKTEIRNLKPNDFVFLLFNPENLTEKEINHLANLVEKFERKLPVNATMALMPSIDNILNSSDKDIIKLFIDDAIETYNTHFNDIYIPYIE